MIALIAFVALALGMSFLCSVLEAVLLSITPSYIASEIDTGHRSAKLWRRYKDDIDRPLAAILSLNTIAHTVGAAGAGAQATKVFGEVYFGVISAVLTLLILVVSEIIPKTLGALFWRKMAPLCAQILRVVIWSMYPLVIMSQGITRLLSKNAPTHSVSRDEFAALAELGAQEGVLSKEESAQLASVLRFRALKAKDVMTPRPVIFAFDENLTVADARAQKLPFSRIPLYREQADNIHGFVRKDDLLRAAIDTPGTPLSALRRELLTVPENQALDSLWRRMVEGRDQMAMVVNEYGSVLGLVTTEDLVETLLGLEIVDETDHTVDMQAMARRLWQQRAERLGLVSSDEALDNLENESR